MRMNLFNNCGWVIPKHFYQFIYNEKDSFDTDIIQYFIMNGLGLCIKVDSYVAHFFNAWSLFHNTSVPIAKKGTNNSYP